MTNKLNYFHIIFATLRYPFPIARRVNCFLWILGITNISLPSGYRKQPTTQLSYGGGRVENGRLENGQFSSHDPALAGSTRMTGDEIFGAAPLDAALVAQLKETSSSSTSSASAHIAHRLIPPPSFVTNKPTRSHHNTTTTTSSINSSMTNAITGNLIQF